MPLLIYHYTFLEGGHAHPHEHKTSPSTTHPQSIAQEERVGAAVTPAKNIPIWSGTRERSDSYSSLYGHPIATRASVVQAAQDIALSGSPSSPTHVRRLTSPQSPSPPPRLSSEESFNSSAVVLDERIPLLGDRPTEAPSSHHHSHGHGSMNMQALVLHVLGDALGNVGVIATGLVIWLTQWKYKFYFDPVISLVITAIIFSSALPLGKSSSVYIWYRLTCSSPECIVHSPSGRSFHYIPR